MGGTANLHGSGVAQGRVDVIRSRLDKKLSLGQPGRTHRTEDDPIAGVLTHCGRVTQICVFNTVKLGTSASSP